MKEENALVIVSLLVIAIASLVIVGWIVYKNGPAEPLNLLIMLVGSVVSGFIGYLTKTLQRAKTVDEREAR